MATKPSYIVRRYATGTNMLIPAANSVRLEGSSVTPGHIDIPGARPDADRSKRKVAVVGAGPAGFACANDMALMGYSVTAFEVMPHAGGMLRYGIPAYRLPRDVIDCQVREIEALGVEFRYSTPLRAGFGVRELKEQGYEAIFLAVGASRGRSVPIEGSDADGVIKAIDYLLNINRGYRVPLGGKVVVIGGGLVAIDAARTAVRALVPGLVTSEEEEQSVAAGTMRVALDAAREAARRGALEVTVASLESEAEMPAMKSAQGREELDIARDEGVTFLPGWGPKRIVIRDGHAVGIELVKCVKVFDEAGRFRPQFDENDKRVVDADAVILAIGQAPDLSFVTPEDGVTFTPAATLKIDPITLETGIAGVFAGCDAAFPPSLLITCAQHGKVAARYPTRTCAARRSACRVCTSRSKNSRPTPIRWLTDTSRSIATSRWCRSRAAPESRKSNPRSLWTTRASRPGDASTAISIRFTTARNASCAIDASISAPSIVCISRSRRKSLIRRGLRA
jgi:formate dehydrogenase beta subunit